MLGHSLSMDVLVVEDIMSLTSGAALVGLHTEIVYICIVVYVQDVHSQSQEILFGAAVIIAHTR